MQYAGLGLLATFAGLAVVLYNADVAGTAGKEQKARQGQQLDASDSANDQFQGKDVQVIGAGSGKRVFAHGSNEDIELVETGTSSVPHFPRTIYLPTPTEPPAEVTATTPTGHENEEEYTLVGLGIRSVSFLSIQVYVAGMYVRTADISALQEKLVHTINESASTLIPSEKAELQSRLLDPAASKQIWAELLAVPGIKTAWRIAPTRNTDFGHLRDGWLTGITNRTREAKSADHGAPTEYEADEFGRAIAGFKGIFAGGRAPKGSVMVLNRDAAGALHVWFHAKPTSTGSEGGARLLGSVADERISRLIWLGYLAGEKVSSEGARRGVVDGCVGFAARPIGSVETMVT